MDLTGPRQRGTRLQTSYQLLVYTLATTVAFVRLELRWLQIWRMAVFCAFFEPLACRAITIMAEKISERGGCTVEDSAMPAG